MQVEQAIFKILRSDAAVAALCGTRIHPGVLPQSVIFPAIAFRTVFFEDQTRLEYPGSSGFGTWRIRTFAVMRGEDGYDVAKRLDKQIRLAMQGFRGTVVDDTVSPQEFLVIQCVFTNTTFDLPYDDKTQTHQIASDFDVTAEEEQPREV